MERYLMTESEKIQLYKKTDKETLIAALTAEEEVKKGNTLAMSLLGLFYKQDIENPTKALYWWMKAAEAGDPDGLYFLGECYINGYVVPENCEEGYKLIQQAAQKGCEAAKKALECAGEDY